jgi:hypothetical protein
MAHTELKLFLSYSKSDAAECQPAKSMIRRG